MKGRFPKPAECAGCPLEHDGESFSRGEGSGAGGLVVIAEALGEREAATGLPLRPEAPAGSVFERCLKLVGIDRQQLRILNVVSCRPNRDYLEGAPYEHAAINHCEVHRRREITAAKPSAILALGGIACRTLTGLSGKKRTVTQLRGYILPGVGPADGIPVIPSIHPSFIRREASNMWGVLMHDIMKAQALAKKLKASGEKYDFEAQRKVQYQIFPGVDEANSFMNRVLDNPNMLLTYDIENPKLAQENEDEVDLAEMGDQPITQIQFSLGIGEGIAFPWVAPYISIAKVILASKNPKAGHNVWKYDNPILQGKYGFEINGRVDDSRWCFHHLQPDLPADLQFVASFFGMSFAWKHLADSELEWYGCADVDSVQRIMAKIPGDLAKRGVLRGYERHVLGIEPIMAGATRRGIRINREGLTKFGEKLTAEAAEIDERVQAHVPDELKKRHPKEGYKKPPNEIKGLGEAYKVALQGEPIVEQYSWVKAEAAKLRSTIGGDEMHGLVLESFPTGEKEEYLDEQSRMLMTRPVKEDRWAWVKAFKVRSGDQIIAYMKAKGHPVPRDFKTQNETTAKEELERLAKSTKDPLYSMILEEKQLLTMVSTFVNGWMPGPDGKVHPEFNYGPATGQFASKGPNAQNSPKHAKKRPDGTVVDLATEFRENIIPSPGCVLVEADYRAFHAATLALEAGDLDYMRLAKLDVHSFMTAQFLKLPGHDKLLSIKDDRELGEQLAWVKKHHKFVRDKKAKPSVLGYGFGLQANHLFEMNRESFKDKKEAQMLLDMIDGTFPKLKAFRDMIKRKAHDQRFLVSRHGYMRWFWDVFHWDARRGCMVPGEHAERAIAFLPANDAFGHKKDAMLRLEEQGLMEKFGFINDIHDALIFDCPKEHLEECLYTLKKEMEYKSEILTHPIVAPEGFSCEVEISVSDENWARMKLVEVSEGVKEGVHA